MNLLKIDGLEVHDCVDDSVVDYFNGLLNCAEDEKYFDPSDTCTINGRQTYNLFSKIDVKEDVINHLCKYIFSFLDNKKKYFKWDYSFIDHIHLIEYKSGGYQKAHHHTKTEDYSFILYLNDSDGDTIIVNQNEKYKISPRRGRLAMFDAPLWHWAEISNFNKRIAVGRVRLHNKCWV